MRAVKQLRNPFWPGPSRCRLSEKNLYNFPVSSMGIMFTASPKMTFTGNYCHRGLLCGVKDVCHANELSIVLNFVYNYCYELFSKDFQDGKINNYINYFCIYWKFLCPLTRQAPTDPQVRMWKLWILRSFSDNFCTRIWGSVGAWQVKPALFHLHALHAYDACWWGPVKLFTGLVGK